MATPTQNTKRVRWLYIAVALIVVLGLAYWLTSYNSAPTSEAPPTSPPAVTTTN